MKITNDKISNKSCFICSLNKKKCNGSNYNSIIECHYIFVMNTVFVGNKIVSSRRVFADSAPTFVFGNGTKKVCSVEGKPISSILIKKS